MKKRLPILMIIVLIIACMFALASCNQGMSPVESIILSSLPKTTYYRGDAFALNSGELTVYYQDGSSELVPLTLNMISDYDAQLVGDQILTVSYKGKTASLKVTVINAPIFGIAIGSTDYKMQYVQGQSLDTTDMALNVTYTNGYTESISVTQDMVTGYDPNILGEQEITVTYIKDGQTMTQTFKLEVVRKEIKNIDLFAPDKTSYVIGQNLDLTGGYLRIAYNDNTSKEILFTDLYQKDNNFKIFIQDVETINFSNSSWGTIVKVVYYGIEKLFTVRVEDVAVKTLELSRQPSDQIKNGTIDLSLGQLHVTYNNGNTEDIALNNPRLTSNIAQTQFNINVVGSYIVRFMLEKIAIDVTLNVIEAKESELIIILPDVIYYQDTGEIDYTTWQYSIKLTNGSLRALDSQGNTRAYLTRDLASFVQLYTPHNNDFTTTTAGVRSYKFKYTSANKITVLEDTVSINVVPKQFIAVDYFKAPTVTTYMQGDAIKLAGGEISYKYNSGEVTPIIPLTRDMFDDTVWNSATSLSGQKVLEFTYRNTAYNTSFSQTFSIKVLEKINSVVINPSSSHSTHGVQGNYFDYSNLILNYTDSSGTVHNETNFDPNEWSFVNDYFGNIGQQVVKVYYGDVNDVSNLNFVAITVNVTNNITSVAFADGYLDQDGYGFDDIIEGQSVTIGSSAYILVTYENDSIVSEPLRNIKITENMLSEAISYNKITGKRPVSVTYAGFTLTAYVRVLNREIENVEIIQQADNLKYAKEESLSLAGMQIKVTYNNGGTWHISLNDDMTLSYDSGIETSTLIATYQNGKETFTFTATFDNSWADGTSFKERIINLKVSLSIEDSIIIDGGEDTVTYTTYWFEKLPLYITLLENGNTLSTINAYEGVNSITFPQEAVLKIAYQSSDPDYYYLSDFYQAEDNYLSPDNYTLTGFDYNSVRNQTIKFSYLLYECTFTVKVLPKILVEITSDKSQISVIEGMPIDAEEISITAHYVDALGREFGNQYGYVKVELVDLISDYDPADEVVFVNKQCITTVTFSFGGKNITVDLIINQKTISSITLSKYPRQIYTEFYSDGIDFSNGMLLVYYNNGTSEFINLDSGISNLEIDSSEYNTSFEINNNNEVSQRIHIYYTVNGVEKATSYVITIKDRKYLTVDYSDTSTVLDGAYQLIYGATVTSRPEFYIMQGNFVFVSNANIDDKIAENTGFTVMYRDSMGVESASFPRNAGLYTLVIRYTGDKEYNALNESTMKIRINKRKIFVNADPYTSIYGDLKPEFSFKFSSGETDGNVFGFIEDESKILSVDYDILRDNIIQTFTQGVVSLNVSNLYKIRPKLQLGMQGIEYNNYNISYTDAIYTVKPLPIVLKARADQTKVYGQSEPMYEYDIYRPEDYPDGEPIGRKEKVGASVVANVTLNGLVVDISSYNLTRNLNLPNAQNVGVHPILAGAASFLNNFTIDYIPDNLTINKKSITIKGDVKTKQYGFITPDFTFSTLNSNDLVYSANLKIYDTFESVFGAYTNPNSYVLKIYANSDIENLNNLAINVNGKYGLPNDAPVGDYKVYVQIDSGLITNYSFTINPVTLTINKTDVKVYANDQEKVYGASDPLYTYGDNYSYAFNAGYLLDETYLNCAFTRESGENIGKYKVSLTPETISGNGNFNISLYGKDINTSDSYLYITPRNIIITRTQSEEVYAKKTLAELAAPYEISSVGYEISLSDKLIIGNAITFSFVGRTDRVQGTGFAVVDTYDGIMTYDYVLSSNFKPSWFANLSTNEKTRINNLIDDYIYDELPFDEQIKITDNFVYTVTPKPLDIEVVNEFSSYNFDNQTKELQYTNLSATLCSDDSIIITPQITVIYKDTFVSVNATSLYNAGVYTITIQDIGNFNYCINNTAYSRIIEILPIEIKVVMKNTKTKLGAGDEIEYYYTNDVYDGRTKQPYDFIWVSNTNAQGNENIIGEGYYYTESYKIVTRGLAGAPNTLTIYPYTLDINGNSTFPKNAGVFDLKVNINEAYKNYTVKFVSPTNDNLEVEYKYVIDKRLVKIINVTSYSTHDYNGTSPKIPSNANIFTDNDVPNELINIKNDITFTFERDMDYVPSYLKAYINEADKTSAGYFNITVNYSKSNNYIFELEGVEHYIIKRRNIEVALNSASVILNKQFDTLAPTALASSLSLIGGTAAYYYFDVNGVILNIDVMAYWNSSGNTWTTTIPANYPVGYYAYTITPHIKTGVTYTPFAPEDRIDTFIKPGETGKKLIDWNHTYTIVQPAPATLTAYGITGMYAQSEGIYQIKKRNVILEVPGGTVESRKIENVQTNTYVYYQMYNGTAITYNEVLAFMNSYQAVDQNYEPIGGALGFVHGNMTCPTNPASIINTEEYYMLNVSNIVSSNPNFNIMYPVVIYEITKLEVELSITAVNGEQGSSMVYGTGYDNLTFVLDFYDKAAFIAAMGLSITPEELLISNYTNKLDGDPQLFLITNNIYQLWSGNNAVYSTSDVIHMAISKGFYTPKVLNMAEYSRNFYFTFVPTSFEVKPKIITLKGIERTYFRKDEKFIYSLSDALAPSEEITVNNLLIEVLAKFMYTTGINITSDAGAFKQDDPIYSAYYLRAIKNDIISVLSQAKYTNYNIDYEINNISAKLNGNSSYTYMALNVNRQSLKVRIAKSDAVLGETVTLNNCISMNFGENLYGLNNRYEVYIDGFASLTPDAMDYVYGEEESAQLSVRASIIGNILKLSNLFTSMSTSPYNYGNIDTKNLTDFYYDTYSLTEYFTNYSINLDKAYYVINKIDIILNLKNLYNENAPFEAVYSELESFIFSDNIYNPTRLEMNIIIANPENIIGYNQGTSYTLIELLMMMNLKNESNVAITTKQMLIDAIEYVITQNGSKFFVNNQINPNTGLKTTDGVKTSAGNAKLALTNENNNKWYESLNYNIICNPSDLIVYPEVKGLGDDIGTSNYKVPYSGVAYVGIEQDEQSFKENLSMYVKLNYQGNPDINFEFVDIKITDLLNPVYYNNYRRTWTSVLLSDPADLVIGKEISMRLTYRETFFFGTLGERTNTITSNEFKVRLYGNEDINLVSGNSYFTYNTSTYNYGDEISGNHTYTLGTYIQSNTGAYLQKNWKGTNYYTEILNANRYNYDPFVDINGLYVKATIPGYGEDYYLIVNKNRYNVVWTPSISGRYLEVDNPPACVPQYVEIIDSLRYSDEALSIPNTNGIYLKYTCGSGHTHALIIDLGRRRSRSTPAALDGDYMRVVLGGVNYEVEVTEGVNTYTLYDQDNAGSLLMVDIYSNIYYVPIESESRYDKANFAGSYDILDTRFRIDPNSNITDYYLDFVIFNDGISDLRIRINNSGYYLYLGAVLLDNEQSIDELDLFDSFSHSMTIYIDKIGSYDVNEETRNYYIILVIDDCYYIKMETGTAITTFGSIESYAKIITNEINVTFTKFEAIAMGINTFSTSNYIADILLLPNTVKSEDFKNYSYHITIPSASMEEVEIDISELFVMGSINSVLGYSPENYYYQYFIDGLLVYSTSKNNPMGSPIYGFERGIYNITIKIFVKYTGDASVTYYEEVSKTIKLSVSQNYNRIELDVGNHLDYRAASVSAPMTYTANSELYPSFYSQGTIDIRYNKMVFDFTPNLNGSKYYLRYILKTSDYSIDMLSYSPTENYYGLMIEHSYNIDAVNGNYNSTKIYMRYLDTLWTFDLGEMLIGVDDAWIGSRNVLEVLYVQNNSYLIVTLSRGETRIFSQKIYNSCAVATPNVSGEDIARIINTEQSYTGLRIHNAAVTVYKYEVGYRMLGAVDFVDNSDNKFISGVSTIESNKKVLVSNADGTAYTSTAKDYFIRFKASALDVYNTVEGEELIRFMIVNNTARLMPMEAYNQITLTGDRGIYLSIVNKSKTERELRLYMYKYDKIYQHQVLYTFTIGSDADLLNGKEHYIEVSMKNTQVFQYYVEANINCYQMSVNLGYYDVEDNLYTNTAYGFYPIYNNMSFWTIAELSTIKDEEADDGNKDIYFVSNVVYSGIITQNSTILIEEFSIC